MTTIELSGQTIQGDQYNIGSAGNIGHIGPYFNFNIPPELLAAMLEIANREEPEDFTAEKLERKDWEPETVFIPAGPFLMGSVDEAGEKIPDYEKPQFKMDLPAYRIGKYPVTNAEYAEFLRDKELPAWLELGWSNGNQPGRDQQNLPVMGVTWYSALAYCHWLIEKTGRPYTLPSEAQWEKAARGPKGSIFPWGNDWQDGALCNTDSGVVTAVDVYPEGDSVYGCCDMVGNVREWTTTLWGRRRKYNLNMYSPYPWKEDWKANNGYDDIEVNKQIRRVTRGGAALIDDVPLRAARRQSELPFRCGIINNRVGFRVALNWEK